MSYGNQRDHRLLDRSTITETLRVLTRGTVAASPSAEPRQAHVARLLATCGSLLERQFLEFLEARNLRLPSHAQVLIESCHTRPDFLYQEAQAVVYVDGPPHDYPERQARDQANTTNLENQGYLVIRLNHRESWEEVLVRYPTVFGVET
jgi:very-short-patch-repair endonuclease